MKALEFFIEFPYKEIYLREFARKMKISSNTAQRFLNIYLMEGFVVEIIRGKMRYFAANLESVVFRQIKVAFSLREIEKSGLIYFFKENNATSLILFGSVAKGLDDKSSDVDLVCIGPNKKLKFRQFEEKIGRVLQVHFFTWAEWKKQAKINKAFYRDVVKDGIALIGEKPVI